jgi:hypothetical protein
MMYEDMGISVCWKNDNNDNNDEQMHVNNKANKNYAKSVQMEIQEEFNNVSSYLFVMDVDTNWSNMLDMIKNKLKEWDYLKEINDIHEIVKVKEYLIIMCEYSLDNFYSYLTLKIIKSLEMIILLLQENLKQPT